MRRLSIEDVFIREGYISVPFTFNGAGHPLIEATCMHHTPTTILLDTGSSANILDYAFAKELGLDPIPTGEKGGGTGGLHLDVYSIETFIMEIHGCRFTFTNFLSMDFTTIKDSLRASGLTADFQGILGFGFFKMTACFIDYAADRIFIQHKNE
jgi:Aspartyl protease